jgi:uncharacterized membrane protein YdcZ (DUF606 family)
VTGLIYIAGIASVVRTKGVPLLILGTVAGQLLASTTRDRRRTTAKGKMLPPPI